jgi:hypothetical protein
METTCHVCDLLPASFLCVCCGKETYTCPGCISIHMLNSPSAKHELHNLTNVISQRLREDKPLFDKEVLVETLDKLKTVRGSLALLNNQYESVQNVLREAMNSVDCAVQNLLSNFSDIDKFLSYQDQTGKEKEIASLIDQRHEVFKKYSLISQDSKKQHLNHLTQLLTQVYVQYACVNDLNFDLLQLQETKSQIIQDSDLLNIPLEPDSTPKNLDITSSESDIPSQDASPITTEVSQLYESEQPKIPHVINSHSVISLRPHSRKLYAYDYVKNSHRCYTMDISGSFPEYIAGCKISDSLLLFSGGFNGKECINASFTINLANLRIKYTSPMKQPRAGHAMICYNSKLYAFGGSASETLKTAEAYNIETDKWEQIPSMTYERVAFTACIFKDKIILTGGFTSHTIEVLDPVSYEYSVLKYTLPYSDYATICTASDAHIYILQNDRLILLNSSYELETDKNIELGSIGGWSQMPPMRDERTFIYELEDTNTIYQIHMNLKEVRMIYGY